MKNCIISHISQARSYSPETFTELLMLSTGDRVQYLTMILKRIGGKGGVKCFLKQYGTTCSLKYRENIQVNTVSFNVFGTSDVLLDVL